VRFLRQLDQRWQQQSGRTQPRKLMLFELRRKAQSYEFEMVRRRLPELSAQSASIDLRAVLDAQQQPTLYCNNLEFSPWQFGSDLYREVAAEVRKLRSRHEDYPLCLSDVLVPDSLSIIEHLQVKQRLESRLNQAMADNNP